MIARAYILAYRIMRKITETNGDTDWLKNGAPHCDVRRDYYDTDRGIKKLTDADRIWKIGQEIWSGISSAMIARAYIHVGGDDTAASQSYQPFFFLGTIAYIVLHSRLL